MGLKELRDVKLQIRELLKTHLKCKQTHNTAATCPAGQILASWEGGGGETKQCTPDERIGSEYYGSSIQYSREGFNTHQRLPLQ